MSYRLNAGIDYLDRYGSPKRAEAGDVVDDLPAKSLEWLVAQGHVEQVADASPAPSGEAIHPAGAQPAQDPQEAAPAPAEALVEHPAPEPAPQPEATAPAPAAQEG